MGYIFENLIYLPFFYYKNFGLIIDLEKTEKQTHTQMYSNSQLLGGKYTVENCSERAFIRYSPTNTSTQMPVLEPVLHGYSGACGISSQEFLHWCLSLIQAAHTSQALFPAAPLSKSQISVSWNICYTFVASLGPGSLEGRSHCALWREILWRRTQLCWSAEYLCYFSEFSIFFRWFCSFNKRDVLNALHESFTYFLKRQID